MGTFDELLVGYQMHEPMSQTVLNPLSKDQCFEWDKYDLAILRDESVYRQSVVEASEEYISEEYESEAARSTFESNSEKMNDNPLDPIDDEEVGEGLLDIDMSFLESCGQMSEDDRIRLGQVIESLRHAVMWGDDKQ